MNPLIRWRRRDTSSWEQVFPAAPPSVTDVLAMTLWGEARGEEEEGRIAVASVIWNRSDWKWPTARYMRGASVLETVTRNGRIGAVCLARAQFSCWEKRRFVQKMPHQCLSWDNCMKIAAEVTAGGWKPSTVATHYHADSVSPYWAGSMKEVIRIGHHVFYA